MSPRTPPGQTREQIYQFVRTRLMEGLPPTVREVQKHFGFNAVQTAHEHLRRLVTEGRLAKQKGKARGYSLPGMAAEHPATSFVPLLGRVHAGGLHEAIEDCEGYIPVQTQRAKATIFPRAIDVSALDGTSPQLGGARRPHTGATSQNPQPSGNGQLFALRVEGESMIDAGILPGDIVIVRSQPIAKSGDIVVALVGDEATVKTLRIKPNRIELHPENPEFEPIIPDADEFRILGKVIETRRYFEKPAL